MNFRGRSIRNLDPKGRLMLSPEYRESLTLRMIKPQDKKLFIQNPASHFTQSPYSSLETQAPHNSPKNSERHIVTQSQNQSENQSFSLQENQNILPSQTPLHPAQFTQKAINNTDEPQDTKLVITTYDNCLAAYPWQDWLLLEEQFARLVNPSSKVRAFRRLFIGGAEEQSLDAQGRIRLSADHREYAQLEKEVTILGLITRFELWNPHLLKSHIAAQSLDDVTEELSASGIDFAL